uniref:UvrD-helicase domain-containing protein n=1 Tax=Providencia sp. PROV033 TaxID=2949765 RepID=UPI002349A52A
DLDLANKLNEIWFEKGLWPIDGVTPTPVECFRTKDGRIFYANGVIKKTGEPVFLTGGIDREYFFDKKEKFHYVGSFDKEESFPIISCISLRNKIMAWGCNKSSVFLDKTSKLEILKFISHDNNLEAPFFDVKLNGELTETNIVELLYQQASFIESMGIEVGCALSKMRKFKSKSVEYHFSNALSIFWPFFEGKISELGYITFNRAFLILSNPSFLSENNNKLNEKYKPLRHLLIDEFQDISPQIALWIKSVQLNISQLELEPSIMAIGDDWQSIYSWRGSSPEIFMNFSRFFPSHKKLNGCKEIYMMENFRSDEKIIRDAEYLMKRVKNKIDKKACSRRLPDGDETGVNFIDYATDDKAWIQDVILLINKQLELVSKQNRCDKNKVIVLSRTNSILNDVMNAGRFSSGVVFHTIHTAKGLQGEIAIILEDSRSLLGHTLRNRIYETVDFISSSYDDAMTDESLRLAYVAVTRGVKRVYWFAPSNSSGAYSQMK